MKPLLTVKNLLTDTSFLGKDGAGIKVEFDSGEGDTPYKPFEDWITYDKYNERRLRIIGIEENVYTLKLVSNDPNDYIPNKYLQTGIKYFEQL